MKRLGAGVHNFKRERPAYENAGLNCETVYFYLLVMMSSLVRYTELNAECVGKLFKCVV